jgi:ribosomal-protein-alanine N-acetyltransferase
MNRNLITGEEEAWVYNISVIDAYQGRGLGRRLLEHAERLAREAGYPVLGLMVSHHNERARRLYEAYGFHTTNHVLRKRVPPA